MEGHWKIWGEGGLKSQFFYMKLNQNFQRGGEGFKPTKPSLGPWLFFGTIHYKEKFCQKGYSYSKGVISGGDIGGWDLYFQGVNF